MKKIWSVLVRAGRRNALLRMGILAVTAVYLFCYHLYKNAKTVSALRYACLFCAGMLALNCVNVPVNVWASDQEEDTGTEPDQSVVPGSLDIKFTDLNLSIIEGYQDAVELCKITLTNEYEINITEVTSHYGDVYALVSDGAGKETEILVSQHQYKDDAGESETETPGEPEEGKIGEREPELLGGSGAEAQNNDESQEKEDTETDRTDNDESQQKEDTETDGTDNDESQGTEGTETDGTDNGESQGTESMETGKSEDAGESEKPEDSESGEDGEETQDSLEGSDATILEPGMSLTYIVRIPAGLQVGNYEEHVTFTFEANEGKKSIDRDISFTVNSAGQAGESTDIPSDGTSSEENPSDGNTEEQPSDENKEEEPSDANTEDSQNGDTEEEGSGEDNPEDSIGDDVEGELPEESDPSEEEEGEDNEELEDESEQGPKLEVVSREGGYYMGNTFFAMATAVYELKVDLSVVSALFCDLNGVSSELSISDGYASFTVPETYNGTIRFYALGLDGSVVEETTEYVIAEKTAPSLDYANVVSPDDGTCAVRVSLEDCGEIISGLNNVDCTVDGVPYTEYAPNVFGKVLLCSGEEVVSGLSFDIPLLDDEIHTVEVVAADNVGNILEESFRVHASQMDVISVVLPTSFGMVLFPNASNGNIWGEDIVVANQSEFPVEVTLKATQVDIDHTLPENGIVNAAIPIGDTGEQPIDLSQLPNNTIKDAKLILNLKLFGGGGSALELLEGYSMPGECFVLEPKNPDTDAAALQNDPSEKTVLSGDYAIVNIRGTISEGSESMWKNGDIAVALTFTFRRLEDPESEAEE